MKSDKLSYVYEAPAARDVELVMEQPVLTSSDPIVTYPDMGWDD